MQIAIIIIHQDPKTRYNFLGNFYWIMIPKNKMEEPG